MQRYVRAIVVVALGGLLLAAGRVEAQEEDIVARMYTLVSEARLDEGLAPYGLSPLLTASAQRHADDLAANRASSHTGSDDSTPGQRIAEAGYAAWTWNGGELVVSENLWTGYGAIEDAMSFFLEDGPHRDNVLSTTYREIGIGVAADADGRNYYVLDFGTRPNVLPIFINDGAAGTDDPQVAIRLTNEEARPGGKGVTFMGQAIEIRVSDAPDFEDTEWQPWRALVPWTLPDTPGEYTVYVQFRDAAGRTAAAADTILLGEGVSVTPTPVSPGPTPESTATPGPTAEFTATPALPGPTPGLTAAPASTAVSVPELPPTGTPSPTSYEPGPSPPAPRLTPLPTWTPLPLPPPQRGSSAGALLAVVAVLQGLAFVLGIYLVLRRGRDSAGEP